MKQFKKIAALVTVLVLVVTLGACSNAPKTDYTIGICQLVSHSAHDDATQGFIDAVNEALPGKVTFHTETAANEVVSCSTIVNQFIAEGVDLILANATPALQVAAASTDEIPILGTSITEYGAVLGLENNDGVVGGNVSGTSDLAPLDQQAQMVKTWFPDAKTVGLLYCSAEVNSQYQVEGMKTELEKLGYTCKYYAFTDSNDLAAVTDSAVQNCDVIYVPTDNTIAANAPIIDIVCRVDKVPVIGGEEGICKNCTMASLCVDYYELGYATGKMAVDILTGKSNISSMPIQYIDFYGFYNKEICADLGLTPPEGYIPVSAD